MHPSFLTKEDVEKIEKIIEKEVANEERDMIRDAFEAEINLRGGIDWKLDLGNNRIFIKCKKTRFGNSQYVFLNKETGIFTLLE